MENSLKYTCLFGGGAIRGVSYVGAVKAMQELGVSPTRFAGSSVGAIFAAFLAVGYNAEELKQIFLKVNFDLFRDVAFGFGSNFALSKGEVFLEWVREVIEQKYYGENYKKGANRAVTFADLANDLVVITTDLSSFECKEFSKYDTPDYEIASAVRISCCMPGLMKPIEYNNRLLVDGDLQKSWPMWRLSKNLLTEHDRILEFRLEGNYDSNNISGLDYANAVYSCMTATATSFVKEIYASNDKFDYIVLNTGDIVIVDFNMNAKKRLELIDKGYEQTINYFKTVLSDKKNTLKHYYEILYSHVNKLSRFIDTNNVVRAKIQLGELFIDLCDLKGSIDHDDYVLIKNFKELFLKNIHYPALFGRISLKNDKLIKAELRQISNKFHSKVVELNSYSEYFCS